MVQESVCFDYVHIINCLPDSDAGGSRRLYETIEDISLSQNSLQPMYSKVGSVCELLDVLSEVRNGIGSNSIPLIHFDAHAKKTQGIEFISGVDCIEYISWNDLTAELGKINAKINNRLFVVFCACAAFYINENLRPENVAPFSVCVSPESDVKFGVIENIIPIFYHSLLVDYDIIRAAKVVEGTFHLTSSEHFLKDVLVRMTRASFGKQGSKIREDMLTEVVQGNEQNLDLKHARKLIKDYMSLDDEKLKVITDTYLCGRDFPFTATQIIKEAKNIKEDFRDT